MARSTSGTYNFQPAIADLFVEAFERIQIYGPALTDARYLISARRSANLLLSDWANRGYNLWAIGDEPLGIPLQPGVLNYQLPRNVIDLADCYLRTYTPNPSTTTIGFPIQPMLANGKPIVTALGDVAIIGGASRTLSCIAGSQYVTLKWPAHGLSPGDPIFWGTPVSVGSLMMSGLSIVDSVPDSDHVTFLASEPAPITSTDMGATPLYCTAKDSPLVGCILPNHGLSVGDTWTVHFPLNVGGTEVSPNHFVGGIEIAAGTYTVEYVSSFYEFYFNPTTAPTTFVLSDLGQILTDDQGDPLVLPVPGTGAAEADAAFENHGFLNVTSQQPGLQFNDIYLWPLSRNDYSMLPNKESEGRPTQFWFNRTIAPQIKVWPVPPNPTAPATNNLFYGFIAYRMRTIQDADPVDGQVLDVPTRLYQAFTAELTAALAEKWKPEAFQAKALLAVAAWERAAGADTEHVSTYVQPQLQGFFA